MNERPASLDEIFQHHYDALVRWCRPRMSHALGEPEDLVHLAYLRCRRRWDSQRSSAQNPAAYLYRALRWVFLDAVRAYQRERDRRWELPNPVVEGRRDLLRGLAAREALASLNGRQLQVCTARLEGKSDREICHELRLTSPALAVHICRARAKLCRQLDVSRN